MLAILLVFLEWSSAAPRKAFPQEVPLAQVRTLLKKSDSAESLKSLGPEAYKHLRQIMLYGNASLQERWQATLALAQIGGTESLPDLKMALEHSQWYLRSAGLLATTIVDREEGMLKAKQFIKKDPALLVRATALQVLAQDKNVDRTFLWNELYNPINFHKGQSLSLRLSILKVLSQNHKPSEMAKFEALSRESTPEIRQLAQQVLTLKPLAKNKNLSVVK